MEQATVIGGAGDLGATRRREFRRMLVLSLCVHAVLLGMMNVEFDRPMATLPGVVTVELVSAPATLAPAPRPAKRAPPRPLPKKIVLPTEPTTDLVDWIADVLGLLIGYGTTLTLVGRIRNDEAAKEAAS